MKRVTFYADGTKYMGWCRLHPNTILELKNWIRSGNTLKIKKEIVNTLERLMEIYCNN